MKKLDFIVVGAQKSGTTSLFKYLMVNKSICMPREKEAVFFSDDERYAKGYDWYFEEFFSSYTDNAKVTGTVTPHYMSYPQKVVERIYKHNPDMKVIMVLRDPIERAISHYKMCIKRGMENRNINDAFLDCLSKEYNESKDEIDKYIFWGEYDRILSKYNEYFEKKNILILSSRELDTQAESVMKKVSSFLSIDYIDSEVYREKFHKGGGGRKIKFVDLLKKNQMIRAAWRVLIPFKVRRNFGYWFDQWNTKDVDVDLALNQVVEEKLKKHFASEYEMLKDV